LIVGGDVSIFAIGPDGLQLIYVADQDTEGVAELYSVNLSTPGKSTRLNPQRRVRASLPLDTFCLSAVADWRPG
jgi:hypothetical protein